MVACEPRKDENNRVEADGFRNRTQPGHACVESDCSDCSGLSTGGECVECLQNQDCHCPGICVGHACACTPDGTSCVYGDCTDCCTGHHANGQCGCTADGDACVTGNCSDCCSDRSFNGQCGCTADGDSCATGNCSDCCSDHSYLTTCGCTANWQTCVTGNCVDCCSGGHSGNECKPGNSTAPGCTGFTDLGLPSGASLLDGVTTAQETVVAVGTGSSGEGVVSVYTGTWSTASPSVHPLHGVWTDGAGHYVAVGDAGTVLTGNGSSWSAAAATGSAPTANLQHVWGVDDTHFWVVGESNTAFYFNAGVWEDHSYSASLVGDLDIWGFGASDVWVVNYIGQCGGNNQLHWNGSSWTPDRGDLGCYATFGIWGASANDIWSVGYSKGRFSHYTGSGWSNTAQYGFEGGSLYAVRGRDATHVWAAGDLGTIGAYDGTTWIECLSPTDVALRGVGVTPTHVWLVGETVVRKD